jgi:hypothetical protein
VQSAYEGSSGVGAVKRAISVRIFALRQLRTSQRVDCWGITPIREYLMCDP